MGLKNRLARLRQKFPEQEIDGFLVSRPENRYYLSGFDGSAGYLLITIGNEVLATDFRYLEQAKRQAPSYEIFKIDGDLGDWLPELTGGLNLRRLGFEAGHLTYARYRKLSEALKKVKLAVRLIPVDGLVESLRAIKEPEEIEFIARAVAITDAALEYAKAIISPAMSERKLAWEIEKFLREEGSQATPFDFIVASGANSALPHAKPSPKRFNPGEPIVIDIGARVSGYSSDLSRTICLDNSDEVFSKVYDTVLGAQLTAIAMIKEGMTGEEADRLARIVIEEAGYGEAFGHALGHGIGLTPHEAPRLGPKSPDKLLNGMVFTVEPGIYISGWGGVRIEDVATIENGKIRVMSKSMKVAR